MTTASARPETAASAPPAAPDGTTTPAHAVEIGHPAHAADIDHPASAAHTTDVGHPARTARTARTVRAVNILMPACSVLVVALVAAVNLSVPKLSAGALHPSPTALLWI